ncbi:MAG: hypoxanthine phosphoribosyltransferase [Clostridia bacterium]|nr:hypoxanthine phosphoribosyltransferase [Clostridia bacterium]
MTASKKPTKYDLSDILFDEETLANRIAELGDKITKDYEGKSIVLIGILKGSVPFISDLMRKIKIEDLQLDFMSVSSYGRSTKSSGVVRILKDLDSDINGKDVIIVEDIIDTGLTLAYLKEYLQAREPKSLKICTLLDKPSRRKVEIKGDYTGFEVEDKFIVGYGLDLDQRYRNLPFISWISNE